MAYNPPPLGKERKMSKLSIEKLYQLAVENGVEKLPLSLLVNSDDIYIKTRITKDDVDMSGKTEVMIRI